MRKGLVGFGHAVHLVLLLDGVALVLGGEEQFCGELLGHWLTLFATGCADKPAEGEREASALRHFARHLIVGASDTARAYLHKRRDVSKRRFEGLKRVGAALLYLGESIVDDGTGRILLAAPHNRIDKAGQGLRTVFKVGTPRTLLFKRTTHTYLDDGRFAP
jgi:hypothetical protein